MTADPHTLIDNADVFDPGAGLQGGAVATRRQRPHPIRGWTPACAGMRAVKPR